MKRLTNTSTLLIIATALMGALVIIACKPKSEQPMTGDEAREALDETLVAEQAMSLTYETVEVTTTFTIGEGVERAAEELRAFVESQVPCSTVTHEAGTVTVDYGKLEDNCIYRGKTYAGLHIVTVARNEPGQVEVSHSWQDMTDGTVTVNGAATVTWDSEDRTRRVEHDLTWLTAAGKTVQASGDRLQSLIEPDLGLQGGIQIDGERNWKTERGNWALDIDAVQVRAQDPVPQAGTYTLTNPEGKQLVLTFERVDDDTIQVTMTGTRVERVFNVHKAGQVSEGGSGAES